MAALCVVSTALGSLGTVKGTGTGTGTGVPGTRLHGQSVGLRSMWWRRREKEEEQEEDRRVCPGPRCLVWRSSPWGDAGMKRGLVGGASLLPHGSWFVHCLVVARNAGVWWGKSAPPPAAA